MQFFWWVWLAVAVVGAASGWFWHARERVTAPMSRVFEPVETSHFRREPSRDFRVFGVLAWPVLWGVAGLALELSSARAPGEFVFDAHRLAWWNWTAGLFFGAFIGSVTRFAALEPERAVPIGLGALGVLMAFFAGVETLRGARIEALLGFAVAWLLARDDDDSVLVSLAAIGASLALLRDTRAASQNWNEAAGAVVLTALFLMVGARFAARRRAWWMLGVASAGAISLHFLGESRIAVVVAGGAICGVILAWHARDNRETENAALFPLLFALALALGANALLQGLGVALGVLAAGAVLLALDERALMARVAALGAVLAIFRLVEARETVFRVASLGDFGALWSLCATAALLVAATSTRIAPFWRPLVTPALLGTGLVALLFVWGPRAASGALAGALATVVFGSNLAARGAVGGALFLAMGLGVILEFSDAPRAVRIAVLLALAASGALGMALWNFQTRRETK